MGRGAQMMVVVVEREEEDKETDNIFILNNFEFIFTNIDLI